MDSLIAAGAAPGAVLGVSFEGRHLYYGTGRLGLGTAARPDSATIYDLASLTKVVSLTSLMMMAVDAGRVELDQPVAREVPEFVAGHDSVTRRGITIRQLLTHSSGLPAWRPLYLETKTRAEALALVDTTPLANSPGAGFVYSDLGAIILAQVIERAFEARIDTLFDMRIAQPLNLRDTRYLPPESWRPRIAPTENDPWRGRVLCGEVHDENAARLDGVSGHAGLFGSARDLVRFADWLLAALTDEADRAGKADTVDGRRGVSASSDSSASSVSSASPALSARVLHEFTRRQDLPPGSSRALGWDTPSGESSGGSLLSAGSFGHTGFTGTSIWLDPARRLAIVLLSNRVHPTRNNPRWAPARGLVADRVVRTLAPDTITP
jgi:serine-type D-Ala-D-Ala carboxypeptidase